MKRADATTSDEELATGINIRKTQQMNQRLEKLSKHLRKMFQTEHLTKRKLEVPMPQYLEQEKEIPRGVETRRLAVRNNMLSFLRKLPFAYQRHLRTFQSSLPGPIELSENLRQGMPENLGQEVSENLRQRVPENLRQEVPEDMTQEVPEKLRQVVPEDLRQEVRKDLRQEVPKDLRPEEPEDLRQEVPENLRKEVPKDLTQEASSTSISRRTSKSTHHQHPRRRLQGTQAENIFLKSKFKLFMGIVLFNIKPL